MEVVKLYPEYKDYLWGGEKLKLKYGKKTGKNKVVYPADIT